RAVWSLGTLPMALWSRAIRRARARTGLAPERSNNGPALLLFYRRRVQAVDLDFLSLHRLRDLLQQADL
ncbi:MAG: hypothetical protein ACI9PX_000755, partial [Reinekea sp.]